MSILKYFERLKRMDDLIRRKATGPPEEFASRLKISKSMLMYELNDLKDLGADIEYCQDSRSYTYRKSFSLVIGSSNAKQIKGGSSLITDDIQQIDFQFH